MSPSFPNTSVSLTKQKSSSGRAFYYLVVYRNEGGERRRKKIATGTTHKSVAAKKQKALEHRIAGGYDPFAPPMPVESVATCIVAFLDDCRSRGLRPKTIQVYGEVLRLFESHVGARTMLMAIDANHIKRFCVQPHLADTSQRTRLRHVKAFLNWCLRAGRLDVSPANDVRLAPAKRKAVRYFTPADVERILTAIDYELQQPSGTPQEQRPAYWLRPMVQLAFYLGLRRGEVVRLRWSDADLEEGRIRIRGSKAGDRDVPIPDVLEPVLRDWQDVTGDGDFVFRSIHGTPLTGNYVRRVFAKYCRLAGVSTTAFHGLRHGTVTALLNRGVPSGVAQKIVGHSSIQVTEQYMHLVTDDMRKHLDKAFGSR